MNNRVKKAMLLSLSAGLTIPILQACTQGETPKDTTEKVLRVATTMGYGPNDEYFRQRFTELYEFANKNVKVEIIPTYDDRFMYGYVRPDEQDRPKDPMIKLKELMKGDNPPDVVIYNFDQMSDLLGENLLTQLDPLITKDKFDTTDIVPAVIDGIKKQGDGKIYGLSPTFSSTAVIYNKKIFDEAGVPYPTDKMTWQQMFDLSRRMTKGEGADRKYGFSFATYSYGDDLYYPAQIYSAPLQLRIFDEKGEKMTVNTDQWENVWKQLIQLKTEKLLPEPIDYSKVKQDPQNFNPLQHHDFLSGRVAMAIIHYGELDQITNAMKNAANIKGFTPFDWDVVTLPVHQEAPDVGGSLGMNDLMSINAKAQNPEEAWKFIQFVNGEEWARLKAGSSNGTIVSRQKYIKKKDGPDFNTKAFTTLIPVISPDNKLYREKQNLYQVNAIGARLMQEVSKGRMQVRDALKQWETEGNQLLQKIKENPNGPLDMPMPKG